MCAELSNLTHHQIHFVVLLWDSVRICNLTMELEWQGLNYKLLFVKFQYAGRLEAIKGLQEMLTDDIL